MFCFLRCLYFYLTGPENTILLLNKNIIVK